MSNFTQAMDALIGRADKKVLARGKALYAEGCVEHLKQIVEGKFAAEVLGSEGDLYDVLITLKGGALAEFGCDCPYDWGDVCKHLVAVALAVKAGKFNASKPEEFEEQQEQQNIGTLLLDAEPTELQAFLLQYAERDSKFANALRVRFALPDFDAELKKISRSIKTALADVSDWDAHDSWGYASVDTRDIFCEIEQRVEQGHTKLAFAALELLYIELLKNFEYQSECELAEEAEDCLTRMAGIAAQAADPGDREFIFERCIALAALEEGRDYGADYADRLLALAAQLLTPENRTQLEDILAQHESGRFAGAFALIHLEVIKHLDGGAVAQAYIEAHLNIEAICKIAVDNALTQQDYPRAETLCIEYIRENDTGFRAKNWYVLLLSIYDKTGDIEKQIAIARNFLLEKHDYSYYAMLKKLFEQRGDWAAEYPALREQCAASLPNAAYMQLLLEENEAVLLLDEVKKRQHTIFTYGAFLAGTYPDEVYCIFWDEIKALAERASDRSMYRDVCNKIRLLADAGGLEDAEALIDLLRQRNQRRPAFLDELKQVEKKLKFRA